MGTDPADLAILLEVLSAHRVKRYETDVNSLGGFVVEFHPPELLHPLPFSTPSAPKADQGRIDLPATTPYHHLFGGTVPSFRQPTGEN